MIGISLQTYRANCVAFRSAPEPVAQLAKDHPHPVKVLFSDIDGTLQHYKEDRTDESVIPPSARRALTDFTGKGGHVVLSTGRTYKRTSKIAQDLKIPVTYYITEQGTRVTDSKGEPKIVQTLDSEEVERVIAAKRDIAPNSNIFFYLGGMRHTALPSDDSTPTKIVIQELDLSKVDQINQAFRDRFPDLNVKKTREDQCEIFSKQASKGLALKAVCGLLGIATKNSAAIGDRANDTEMLQAAKEAGGVSIAMGNATHDLLDIAEYKTGHVKEDGYAQAIGAIMANNSRLVVTA